MIEIRMGCAGAVSLALLLAAGSAGAVAPAPLPVTPTTPAQLVSQINAWRAAGSCGNRAGAPVAPLTPHAALAAVRIRTGMFLENALGQLGYEAERADAILVSHADDLQEALEIIRARHCSTLLSSAFSAIGVQRDGANWQIVLAQPVAPLSLPEWPLAGQEVLQLVNTARATGRSCGERWYPPAPPIVWNERLGLAALAHSQDMAAQKYFAHRAKDGSLVGERTLRAGYRWRTVGENIAAGQTTPAEAVDGWLSSPGHCSNIMHPGFTEMGGAYAIRTDRRPNRVYWTQVFATP